eukprot:NODE_599_length_6258_cov_0.597987.p2 type:complete len:274 gc:universal NODE_599_length_6258_cov_0.597987:674-1495(+)
MKQLSCCTAFLRKIANKNITTYSQLKEAVNPIVTDKKIKTALPAAIARQTVEGGTYFVDQDKFVFKNGVEVNWNIKQSDVEPFINEKFTYTVGESFRIQKDFIQIDKRFNTKLAVSIAISRSVLLEDMENSFDNFLLETKGIPEMLTEGRFNKIKRGDIQKHIGQFMQLRYRLNLSNAPYAELSEFTWNDEHSEKVMKESLRYFDIYSRVTNMNQKLDYANEITNLLKSHLTERHGFRLEWIIIILIALEFALSLSQEWRYHHDQRQIESDPE